MSSTPATGPAALRRDALRNRQEVIRAAVAAVHRAGPQVPMAAIAADAGVGVATLYRHVGTREEMLAMLTHRSFEQVLANARSAQRDGTDAVDSLRRFVEAAISQRDELVLPLHGGPPVTSRETEAVRDEVHLVLRSILARGVSDGVLRPDIVPRDVVAFGALLAQPHPPEPSWDTTCRRLLDTYLRGLSAI